MTILTGVCYTVVVTIFTQAVFPRQANGSFLEQDGKYIASELIGQEFSSEKYFWGRPSSTDEFPYNAAKSGASNLGPTNPILLAAVQKRVQMLKKFNPDTALQIPIELVTASASGLDPEISIRAAMYQVARIAKARNINTRKVQELIFNYSNSNYLNIYSVPRVNVILINLALDQLSKGI